MVLLPEKSCEEACAGAGTWMGVMGGAVTDCMLTLPAVRSLVIRL